MTKFTKVSEAQFCKDAPSDIYQYENIILPRRATALSAGYDIYSPVDFTLTSGETIKIPTGIKVQLENNQFLMVVPRSGLGFKFRLQLDNTVGIIDADYSSSDNEGHIWIKITNDSKQDRPLSIKKGEAIAQGIILLYCVTDDDQADGIRNGGFGSTTK